MADRDDHVLFGDQVLDIELAGGGLDPRAPFVAELLPNDGEVVLDDLEHLGRAVQDRAEPLDQLDDFQVLVLDLLALEAGQA
jgi:hypothetical protein